jgi:hypothetical protein
VTMTAQLGMTALPGRDKHCLDVTSTAWT